MNSFKISLLHLPTYDMEGNRTAPKIHIAYFSDEIIAGLVLANAIERLANVIEENFSTPPSTGETP